MTTFFHLVRLPAVLLAAALATPAAFAAGSHADHDHATAEGMAQPMPMMQMPAASRAVAQSAQASGEVRRIDSSNGKITLRHGPIPSLGMGAMTMNYRLADPKLIDGLKVGDKVRFTVQQRDGADWVTQIDKAE